MLVGKLWRIADHVFEEGSQRMMTLERTIDLEAAIMKKMMKKK